MRRARQARARATGMSDPFGEDERHAADSRVDAPKPRSRTGGMPTILVTGSSRGIGLAIAEALRARGVHVIGHATRATDSDTVPADFAQPTAPQMLWEEALERAEGRIDGLVNNAGLFAANPLDLSDIAWLDVWE